jgi:hypothetical protein
MDTSKASPWKKRYFSYLGFATLLFMGCGIIAGFYYWPLETILILLTVMVGIMAATIINRTADGVERAKRIRDPVPPDRVLSFSLEDKQRHDEQKIVAFTLRKEEKHYRDKKRS